MSYAGPSRATWAGRKLHEELGGDPVATRIVKAIAAKGITPDRDSLIKALEAGELDYVRGWGVACWDRVDDFLNRS